MRCVVLVVMALSLAACGPASHTSYGGGGGTGKQGGGEGDKQDPVKTPGFTKIAEIFANNRCLQCHSAAGGNSGGINLETYASTFPNAGAIKSAVFGNFMPQGGPPLSQNDKDLVTAWVDAGAPEQEPQEPEPQITFAEVNSKIFTPMCVRCHSGFDTHAGVTGRLASIQQAIDSNRMPRGGPPVSDELKGLLAKWIAQGAPL